MLARTVTARASKSNKAGRAHRITSGSLTNEPPEFRLGFVDLGRLNLYFDTTNETAAVRGSIAAPGAVLHHIQRLLNEFRLTGRQLSFEIPSNPVVRNCSTVSGYREAGQHRL